MKANIRFGIMCAFGAMVPVAFGADDNAKEAAASAISGYSVSFSGGG
jgi:hypothetical protein